ncbi:hypothetical protein P3G55_19175 [Leptospira sp. 96542]|nr:hypothetical protein [Leptospira sp. 96542]
MKNSLLKEETQLALFFILFSVLGFFVLFYTNFDTGEKIAILTAVFHFCFLILAIPLRWQTPFQIWKFLIPLSIFMVFPDWFLSSVLQVLVFPEDGFIKIGTVSAYMTGLWVIPLFICVYTGIKMEEKSVSIIGTCVWVSFLGLAIFGISEATMWMLGSWYAQNVKMWNHVAYYVLVPEMILAVTTYLAYQGFSQTFYLLQIGIGFLVMILYVGNLSFFYLLIEKII